MGQEEESALRSAGRSNVAVTSPLFLSTKLQAVVTQAAEKDPSKGSCLVNSPKRHLLRVDGERGARSVRGAQAFSGPCFIWNHIL